MPFINENKLLLTLALTRMRFLSCGERLQLLKKLDNVSALALLSKKDLELIVGRPIKAAWSNDGIKVRSERDIQIMEQYGISLVTFDDDAYPALLREIPQPPFALYYRGDISCLKAPCLGIVGTRHATNTGLKAALASAKACAEKGITVVSGLAAGIDGAAHKGALDAVLATGESGKTAALLGSGLDVIYPAAHKKLASSILRNGGCILSEYPLEETPRNYYFPERDRLISGVSRGVLCIEAPQKSGALITVDFAIEQNRDVWFHPQAIAYAQKDVAERHNENKDVFMLPSGVLKYVQEGAPVADDIQNVIDAVYAFCPAENSLF